jgi:hypothetical protein
MTYKTPFQVWIDTSADAIHYKDEYHEIINILELADRINAIRLWELRAIKAYSEASGKPEIWTSYKAFRYEA